MKLRSDWKILFGPPGTGKTTSGMAFIGEQIENGVTPDKIGYIAFTRKASLEAKDRAVRKFSFNQDDMNYFRTIHSLCFMHLGVRRSGMMQKDNWVTLGKALGVETSGMGVMNEEAYNMGTPAGDRYFFLDNLARITRRPLREVYEERIDDDLYFEQLEIVHDALKKYKEREGLLDFTDLLEKYIESGVVPKLGALFVDEAQDLSKIQWEVVHKLAENVPVICAAGDDDQAIYRWAGASVEDFLNLQGNKRVLSKSYRIPRAVHTKVVEDLLPRIENRQEKVFTPDPREGYVNYVYSPYDLDMEKGTWLLLARNSYALKEYEHICQLNGYSYETPKNKPLESPALRAIRDWTKLGKGSTLLGKALKNIQRFHGDLDMDIDDDGYYTMANLAVSHAVWYECFSELNPKFIEWVRGAMRRGEDLREPRIIINTIHGSKGGEADHVAVITDMAARSYRYMDMFPDDECRVFYVALTRAKVGVNIIQPSTNMSFDI